jgi:hypothetical protein
MGLEEDGMTVFVPTTLLSVYRDVDVDEFDDPIDDSIVIEASDLPAVVTEKSQRTFLPAEQRLGMIERYIIRLRPGTDVREGDRLRDQFTNTWYQIQEVINVPLIVGAPDVRVTATRISARSADVRVSRTDS